MNEGTSMFVPCCSFALLVATDNSFQRFPFKKYFAKWMKNYRRLFVLLFGCEL